MLLVLETLTNILCIMEYKESCVGLNLRKPRFKSARSWISPRTLSWGRRICTINKLKIKLFFRDVQIFYGYYAWLDFIGSWLTYFFQKDSCFSEKADISLNWFFLSLTLFPSHINEDAVIREVSSLSVYIVWHFLSAIDALLLTFYGGREPFVSLHFLPAPIPSRYRKYMIVTRP